VDNRSRNQCEASKLRKLTAEVHRMQRIHELLAKRNALLRVLTALKEGRLGR
jgi:hypothetical protein